MAEMSVIDDDLPTFGRENTIPCFVKGCNEKAYVCVPFGDDQNGLFWRLRKSLEFDLVEKGGETIIRIALCPRHFEEWKKLQKASSKAGRRES